MSLLADERLDLPGHGVVDLDLVVLCRVLPNLGHDLVGALPAHDGVAVEARVPAVQNLRHAGILAHDGDRELAPLSDPLASSAAAAVQQVLLPPGLPDVPGWAMATMYEPIGPDVLMGGGLYDWFALPDGDLLVCIGTVSSRGPSAAALGLSIRKTLRGAVWATNDPSQALAVVERALADDLGEQSAALCLIEVTPGAGHVRVLLAGHPVPWLRHGGRYSPVSAPVNPVLGADPQDGWSAADIGLESDDALLIFTSGLLDARTKDGRTFGSGPLREFLDSLPPGLSSYEIVLQADNHLRRVITEAAGDVIIGALAFRPVAVAGAETVSGNGLYLRPQSTSVAQARAFAAETCRRLGLSATSTFETELVVSELVTNAVLHARTDIELRITFDQDALRIAVRDASPDTFVRETPHGSQLLDHGRGLQVVQRLARSFGATPVDAGKVVWAVLPVQ